MAKRTKISRHDNCNFIVKIYNNVIFIIKFLKVKKIFEKIPDYCLEDKSESSNINIF